MNDDFRSEKNEFHYPANNRLDPIGRSLRSTFEPPDGEELQPRIASLMIELSHQHYEADAPAPSGPPPDMPPASILRRLSRFLHRG